jgi:hypothetical protein
MWWVCGAVLEWSAWPNLSIRFGDASGSAKLAGADRRTGDPRPGLAGTIGT